MRPLKSKNSLLKTSRWSQQPSSSNVQYKAPMAPFLRRIPISPFDALVLSKCHWSFWIGVISRRVFGFHLWRNWTPKPAAVLLATWYVRVNCIQLSPKGTHEETESMNVRMRTVANRTPLKCTPRWSIKTLLWDIVEKRANPRRRIEAMMNHGTSWVYFPEIRSKIGQTRVKRDQAIVKRGMIMTGRSSEGNQPSTKNPTMPLPRTPTSFGCCISAMRLNHSMSN